MIRKAEKITQKQTGKRAKTPKFMQEPKPLISSRCPNGGSYWDFAKPENSIGIHNSYKTYNWEKYASPTQDLRKGEIGVTGSKRPVTAAGRVANHNNSNKHYTWDMYANPTQVKPLTLTLALDPRPSSYPQP